MIDLEDRPNGRANERANGHATPDAAAAGGSTGSSGSAATATLETATAVRAALVERAARKATEIAGAGAARPLAYRRFTQARGRTFAVAIGNGGEEKTPCLVRFSLKRASEGKGGGGGLLLLVKGAYEITAPYDWSFPSRGGPEKEGRGRKPKGLKKLEDFTAGGRAEGILAAIDTSGEGDPGKRARGNTKASGLSSPDPGGGSGGSRERRGEKERENTSGGGEAALGEVASREAASREATPGEATSAGSGGSGPGSGDRCREPEESDARKEVRSRSEGASHHRHYHRQERKRQRAGKEAGSKAAAEATGSSKPEPEKEEKKEKTSPGEATSPGLPAGSAEVFSKRQVASLSRSSASALSEVMPPSRQEGVAWEKKAAGFHAATFLPEPPLPSGHADLYVGRGAAAEAPASGEKKAEEDGRENAGKKKQQESASSGPDSSPASASEKPTAGSGEGEEREGEEPGAKPSAEPDSGEKAESESPVTLGRELIPLVYNIVEHEEDGVEAFEDVSTLRLTDQIAKKYARDIFSAYPEPVRREVASDPARQRREIREFLSGLGTEEKSALAESL